MEVLRQIIKWMKSHRVLSTFIVLLMVGAAILARFISARSAGSLSEPVQKGNVIESVYGIGTVTANKIFRLSPGVVNTITKLYVREGDQVQKNQKLLGNEAAVIRAPFAGTVTALPYKVGENVFPQVPILILVDLQDRYLVVSMEQQGALRVRKGQKVRMSFDTIREQNYDGVVSASYSNNNNFLARIDIASLPPQILPGMTADVAIAIHQHDNVLLIPVSALEQGKYVWLQRGHSIPQRIEVKLGIVDKALAEIISGDIEVGDRLLVRKDLNP